LLGVHSRYGLHTRAVTVFRDTLSEGFSYFVTSIAAPAASGWSVRRVGFAPTGRRLLVTAHTQSGHRHSRGRTKAKRAVNYILAGVPKHHLKPDGDARLIACRMVRNNRKERASVAGFNRPISYPPLRY